MATKKISKSKKVSKKADYRKPGWAKNVVIGILMAAIVCVTMAFATTVYFMRGRAITDEQATYLDVFPELARNVAENLNILDDKDEVVRMTGYGRAEEDGHFYIDFEYAEVVDGVTSCETKHGRVYIVEDAERPGSWGYAYTYD